MGNSSKEQALSKIRFLEDQLVSLDHYLPESDVTPFAAPVLMRADG